MQRTAWKFGAHFASERDILKVARSLFLDESAAEFEARKKDKSTGRKARLEDFHEKDLRSAFPRPRLWSSGFRHHLPGAPPVGTGNTRKMRGQRMPKASAGCNANLPSTK